MFRCPSWVEDALWRAAPSVDRGALVDAIVARSRAYTSERDRIGVLSGAADLAARAVFFAVADAAKIMLPLAELQSRGALPETRPLRVLDAGAGTGAMTLGLAAHTRAPLDVVAIDRDRAALDVFRAAFESVADSRLSIVNAGLDEPRWGGGRFDLAVAGTVFNEVLESEHVALARDLLDALAPGGALVIVEPALRDTARALHRLRDALIDAGDAHVFAPCVRGGTPCPMLADERDWCHEDRPTQLPPRAAALAAATGLRDAGLKFSYLVLRREPGAVRDPAGDGRRVMRVVSHPSKQKGKIELYGCGDTGRAKLRLLRRNRSEANRPFERAARGDVLTLGDADEIAEADRVDGWRAPPSP
jgi:ribosomal protein RSM22 (predicted rRNA methylase)